MAIQTNHTNDSIKVLLIEDDEDDFVLTRDLLLDIDRNRFQLDWAKSYEKGVNQLNQNSYDLCFVDFRLGAKTGVELINTITKNDINSVPFIMLTGENDRDTDLQAMRVGAYDFLTKGSLEPVALERTIRYTLERKHTEQKLKSAEAKYRTYFENAIEGIFQTSLEGKLLSANPALASICGYDNPEEMITSITDVEKVYVKPGRRKRLLTTVTKKGKINNFESQIYKKNGEIIWISENIRTIYNKSGEATHLEGTVQDITIKKHAEEEKEKLIHAQIAQKEAEAAQKRLKYLADSSKILSSSLLNTKTLEHVAHLIVPAIADWCTIDTLTHEGTLTSQIIYHKDEKMQKIGEKLRKIYPSSPKSSTGIYAAIRTKKSQFYKNVTGDLLKKSSVNEKHFKLLQTLGLKSAMIVPMIAHQEVLGTISFIRSNHTIPFTKEDLLFAEELAARAASAIDNANLYEQAKEGIRVRDEFLNIASHELKTPLTSLQLQMQIILKMIEDKEHTLSHATLANLLQSSTKQIKRLAQLVNDLLDVSRMSNKKLELTKEYGNLYEIVKTVVNRFAETINSSDSSITLNGDKNVYGTFDASRIDQVITNLISNAVKYGEGQPITITLKKNKKEIFLEVKDKGIGMTKKETEKIFDRFERTETAKQFGGVGLGLYIVNEIIKAHGGTINVKSKKEEGTTFLITLPQKSPIKK